MHKPSPFTLLSVAAACMVAPLATPLVVAQDQSAVPEAVAHARDAVFPALVHVETLSVQYWGGVERRGTATGSGTIISPDGLVLTNAHVTDLGERYWVTLSDNQRVRATLIGQDEVTDLALLRIDTDKLDDPEQSLPHASLSAEPNNLQVGQTVLAMGSPYALDKTVTLGIVSNTGRVFTSGREGTVEDMYLDWSSQRTGQYTVWVQHDALISPGNSGGPLVNLQGEIVGINTRGGGGHAFATPSAMAAEVVDAILEHGEVRRSWIGIDFKHLERTGFTEGVFVDSVERDGPAWEAGVRPGDIVLTLNEEPVHVRFAEQIPPLQKTIADIPVGESVELTVRRKDETHEFAVATQQMLRDRGKQVSLREWGMTVQEITPFIQRRRQLDSLNGVLVSDMTSGRPAQLAEPSIGWGAVITSIGGTTINTMDDALKVYNEFIEKDLRPQFVVVEFDQRDRSFVTAMKTEPLAQIDPPRELPRPWLGMIAQPVLSELASQLGHNQAGFRIARVFPGTSADRAGLKVGDIITALNGESMLPRVMEDSGKLVRALRDLDIGETASITAFRKGETLELTAELEVGPLTIEQARRDRQIDFGLLVRELTFFDRDSNRWDEETKGVMIDSVEEGRWADLGGLSNGMLIQAINDMPVRGIQSYRTAMETLLEEEPQRVIFAVRDGRRSSFKFVEPEWRPQQLEDDENPAPVDEAAADHPDDDADD